MADLTFCAYFPFSEKSRDFLKEKQIAPESVSEHIIKKAALLISRANSGQEYKIDAENLSEDLLETDIVAFPVAKIILSAMRTQNIIEKFSFQVKKRTFDALISSKNQKTLAVSLADDFQLIYSFSEKPDFAFEVPLLTYLDILFIDEESKLVNKHVTNGTVFLTQNDFARFLSEKAYKKVFESLPIEKKYISKKFEDYAKSIDPQLATIEKKTFDLRITGKVEPDCFPPCMGILYADMAAGKKLPHVARLALASFLFQVNMSKTDVIALFAKSPDYKKHLTDYHVERIFQKKMSAPGCKKMAEYGLKVKECEKACTFNHPLQFYLAQVRIKNRIKNNSKVSTKGV